MKLTVLAELSKDQLRAIWNKAHRRKYKWGVSSNHARRCSAIQYRVDEAISLKQLREIKI